jgi:glycosyltransferase involved in cell wall biosynthesis
VGRLDRVKNQLALLTAFARLVAESPAERRAEWRLLIAGDGPMADELRARAVELRIDDLVWMAGAREDVPQLMRALDVFVLPSMNEGISNTILEAMASGRPVVAARVGGNPELIQDGVTGSLYDDRDPEGLAQALRRYRDTPGLAAAHGTAGRARVRERFSIQAMVNGYTDFYGRLLNT